MILPDSGTAFFQNQGNGAFEISVPLLRVYSIRGNALLTTAFPLMSFPHCANDIFPRHIELNVLHHRRRPFGITVVGVILSDQDV